MIDDNGAPVTETTVAPTEKKPRAPRRAAVLMVGHWTEDVRFVPAALQPPGKASKELKALQAWLRYPAVAENLAKNLPGKTISVIRKELLTASYEVVSTTKAKVS